MTLIHHHHHPPPTTTTTQTLRQQYLSWYWPDFDQTLNKGSWEHIQKITTVTRQHLSWGHLSISAIYQLLLARFGPNFKQRVRGTYTTDYNCHHGICPDNICPGDICHIRNISAFTDPMLTKPDPLLSPKCKSGQAKSSWKIGTIRDIFNLDSPYNKLTVTYES